MSGSSPTDTRPTLVLLGDWLAGASGAVFFTLEIFDSLGPRWLSISAVAGMWVGIIVGGTCRALVRWGRWRLSDEP